MEYTKTLHAKLLNRGFKFDHNHTDKEINYDVFKRSPFEVTLDHTNKEVVVDLMVDDSPIPVKTLSQLEKLISVFKSIELCK